MGAVWAWQGQALSGNRGRPSAPFPACAESALSSGPRELEVPTAREGAAATD